jgi:hypothetical protein
VAEQRGRPSPLPVILLGHSQGGMVAKAFVSDLDDDPQADPKKWYRYFVSVASPFYGTITHVNRYYNASPDVMEFAMLIAMLLFERQKTAISLRTGWGLAVNTYRKLVATFPGLYLLCPAPRSVLDDATLATVGLQDYPVHDPLGSPIDILASGDRLPGWVRTYYGHLATAIQDAFWRIGVPLTGYSRERTYHLRGVTADAVDGLAPIDFEWNPDINTDIDIDPLHAWSELKQYAALRYQLQGTAHDGTVPLWSAALASAIPGHVRTFTNADHGRMVSRDGVIRVVRDLGLHDQWQGGPVESLDDPFDPASMDDDAAALCGGLSDATDYEAQLQQVIDKVFP